MTEEDNLSSQEKETLKEYLGFGTPLPEEKHNVHSFLYKVATADDTTKVGNLTAEEVGLPKISLRGLKNAALIAEYIVGNKEISEYLKAKGEILTSTSLSKDAKLLTLAVIQKRILTAEDTTKIRKQNAGWFKPKEKTIEEGATI